MEFDIDANELNNGRNIININNAQNIFEDDVYNQQNDIEYSDEKFNHLDNNLTEIKANQSKLKIIYLH